MSQAKRLLALLFMVIMSTASTSNADQPNPLRKPMVQTPASRTEVLGALREGHVRVFGTTPNKNRLAMAWGQVAFENGHGRLSFNHNLGNVGPSATDQPTYYNRGDQHIYRHFETFVDGAEAYWRVLKRCSAALARFDQGNPTEAARILKRCGYFEADLDVYTRGFVSLYYFAHHHVFAEEEREQQERERQADLERACERLYSSPARSSFCSLGCY